MRRLVALSLLFGLLLSGCAANTAAGEEALQPAEKNEVTTALELQEFFESGGSYAQLKADINMEDTMLKLTSARGSVELIGNGYTIAGSAPCVIRMEDGCSIALNGVTVSAKQTGIGLLGGGTISAADSVISAKLNAIQAAGALTIAKESSLTLSGEGSGILALGVSILEDSALTVSAVTTAITTGRGDLTLYPRAKIFCEAAGDNAVKVDGTLVLMEEAVLEAANTGEHNGARIGSLQAKESATLNAKGGVNGAGLFVVELYEDIALRGFSTPDLKIEAGKGNLTFDA